MQDLNSTNVLLTADGHAKIANAVMASSLISEAHLVRILRGMRILCLRACFEGDLFLRLHY